jgi:alpha-L-rhamnosidase
VAGIGPDPEAPGMRRVCLRPHLLPGLDHARAAVDTAWGRVESAWRREGTGFAWDVTVPANTRATAFVPCGPDDLLTEGGVSIVRAEGVCVVERGVAATVCRLVAGRYRFAWHAPAR